MTTGSTPDHAARLSPAADDAARPARDTAPAVATAGSPPAPVPPAGAGTPSSPQSSRVTGAAAGNARPVPGPTRVVGDSSAAVTGGRAEASRARPAASLKAHGSPPTGSRAHAAIAAAMTEAQLEEHIRALCTDLGILRFHVRDSRGMNRGLPDDILIGARGVLWRECKTAKGRLTPEQRSVGEALTALGQDFAVWRPATLISGQIARELAALAGLRGAS